MQRSIALVGLSGVGKSTIARLLATRLGWAWADTDALIVAAAGRPIAALFADEGEAAFRNRESAVLAAALAVPQPCALATGGGIVLREANRRILQTKARVAWLDAPDAEIVARLSISAEERPLLANNAAARIAALRASREPLYRALAEVTICTADRSPTQVAELLFDQMCYNYK